jgi:hypothetical protein
MYGAILMRAIVLWQQGTFYPTPADTPALTNTLNSYAIGTPLDSQASALHTDDSLSPSSLDSVGVADQSMKNDNYGNSSPVNSLNCMGNDQVSCIVQWTSPLCCYSDISSLQYFSLWKINALFCVI